MRGGEKRECGQYCGVEYVMRERGGGDRKSVV